MGKSNKSADEFEPGICGPYYEPYDEGTYSYDCELCHDY